MTAPSFATWTKRLIHGWHPRRRCPVRLVATDARPAIPLIPRELVPRDSAGSDQICVPAGWSALGKQCARDGWRCCPGTSCMDTTDGVFGADRMACS